MPDVFVPPEVAASFPPPEDADGPEEFLAALQRHTLPALPVLRRATLQSPPSLPPIPPVISTSLPHDLALSPSLSLGSSPNRHGSVFGSSPTLQGNNTPPSGYRETPVDSPSESTLRKRKAYLLNEEQDGEFNDSEEDYDEEEDEAEWRRLEEAAQQARASWTGLKVRIPACGAAAGGGGRGGHGGDAGSGNPINMWTPDCSRRGDAECTGSAAAIGHMPCNQVGCSDCEGGGGNEEEENNDDGAGQGSGRWLQGHRKNNAQGGTLYILPIIAALNLRTYVTRQVPGEDILSLASALRRVKHGMWRPMVHQFMVPIFHMRGCSSGYVEGLRLHWNVPQPVGNSPTDVETFAFRDVEVSDRIFDGIETNFPILHKRSPEWDSASVPAWKALPDPSKTQLAPIFTLKTPLKYEKTASPVTKANRNEFTDTQRGKAKGATVAKTLDDLQARVNYLHAGGKAKLREYVKIRSDILEGRALHLVDNNGKLLSLLFMVPPKYRQRLFNAIMHIHTCMPGEFKDADSREIFFKYLACHYSWYARYAEKGKGAPQAHPDNVRKDHAGRVNLEQRNVHRFKDMKDPNEYSVLVEAYTDFFEILRFALKEYLPEDYDELSIFVEHLPLDASSPCYPFGDKKLCLVVPFGNFTRGELCLYETGFCFDLKLGDVLVFPSGQEGHWFFTQIVKVMIGFMIVTDGLHPMFVILNYHPVFYVQE
ncbi:hypothetical protein K438DRAFT_2006955 [Mycena galopus ATCC 62051]|nr:hypothetical protein K438DRAFT_2006955 [Mycena galopus ATCC 62051]